MPDIELMRWLAYLIYSLLNLETHEWLTCLSAVLSLFD